jgi:hypothetical protein
MNLAVHLSHAVSWTVFFIRSLSYLDTLKAGVAGSTSRTTRCDARNAKRKITEAAGQPGANPVADWTTKTRSRKQNLNSPERRVKAIHGPGELCRAKSRHRRVTRRRLRSAYCTSL